MWLFTYIAIKTSEETLQCIISNAEGQNSGDLIVECQKIERYCVFHEMTNLLIITK